MTHASNGSSATFRVTADVMEAHYARMRRVALRTLGSCGPTAVVSMVLATVMYAGGADPATLVLVGALGAATPVLLVGILVGVDVLLRSQRGLSRLGDLVVTFAGGLSTAQRGDAEPHVIAQPVIGGQAFADHVQLTVGVIPKPLFQLELPLVGADRAQVLAYLRGIGVHVPDRPSFAKNLALILTLAGPAVVVVVLTLKLIQLLVVGALLHGLTALPVYVAALVVVALALAGTGYVVVRLFRVLRSTRG